MAAVEKGGEVNSDFVLTLNLNGRSRRWNKNWAIAEYMGGGMQVRPGQTIRCCAPTTSRICSDLAMAEVNLWLWKKGLVVARVQDSGVRAVRKNVADECGQVVRETVWLNRCGQIDTMDLL